MFCIQCEQTLSNPKFTGCQLQQGMCGKTASTADLQDVLNYQLQGISQYACRLHELKQPNHAVDAFSIFAFFTTLTNVNFDDARFLELIAQATAMRDQARSCYEAACKQQRIDVEIPAGPAQFVPAQTKDGLLAQAEQASIRQDESGADVYGLRCLILYGLKGTAAYAHHAEVLGQSSAQVYADFHRHMAYLATKPVDISELLQCALDVGGLNLKVMELLDTASTEKYGVPEPTRVRTSAKAGKCLLVSGHDLLDLEAILKQTEGKGVNVYTHGEMLPGNAYPELKKYPHLVGNYGGAWQNQQVEFASFPGAIVMTSNCLIDPNLKGYQDRVFTTGPVGWPGVTHIADHDFQEAVCCALEQPGFERDMLEESITIGFGHGTVLGIADKVVEAVKSGDIRHFFLIGGCDGAKPGRNYYTDFAENTPDDTVMMTIGCCKYRFNKSAFGDIGGIPRLLDLGQCNDSYSAIKIALALAEAFDCGVNELPLTLIVSWFEQKAAAIFLTLLHLGIQNIHLGPTLPQYLSPNLASILVEKYNLKPITAQSNAKADMEAVLKPAA